jgi:hypothetical protein
MKTQALILALLLASASGCTTSSVGRPCVGVLDQKEFGVRYELSVWNAILAVIFSETVIVPIYVVAKDLECPIP